MRYIISMPAARPGDS